MKHFRVKYGYKNDEFISVDEQELGMATRARLSGKTGVFKEGIVAGDKIIAIVPDWQRVMGWNRDYNLVGEDYDHIGPKIQREYQNLLEETKYQIENGTAMPRLN